MFRHLFALILMIGLSSPGLGQDSQPSRSQLEEQRGLLLRYGSTVMDLNQQEHLFARIREIATEDQLYALDNLRISPSQARKLMKVVQENLPEGKMDEDGFKEFRRQITPDFEDILGSEQFDLLLELLPSPQQRSKFYGILNHAGLSDQGQLTRQAAKALSQRLTPAQREWMSPLLELFENDAKPRPPQGEYTPVAYESQPPSRQLMLLQRTSVGEIYALRSPGVDFSHHLESRYRIRGGDPNILANVSTSYGLPVRILGHVEGDIFQVATTKLLGPPAVLAVTGGKTLWRGVLPAKVSSSSPPTLEVDLGFGETVTAEVELTTSEQRRDFEQAAQHLSPVLVHATGVTDEGKTVLYDVAFEAYQQPQQMVKSGVMIQTCDQFLRSTSKQLIEAFQNELQGGREGQFFFELADAGVTLNDCSENQLRAYVRGAVGHSGLTTLEGEVQVLLEAQAQAGKVTLKPVPGSLELRVTFPLAADLPLSWRQRLEKIMGEEYLQGLTFDIPEEMKKRVTANRILDSEQLDQLKLYTYPAPDRRHSLLTVVAPESAGPTTNAFESRLKSPDELAVVVSEKAINRALEEKLPEMLPLIRPIPEDLQEQQGVKLTKLEVKELDMSFRNGWVDIRDCRVDVHWRYALFAGVEPGIRFSGRAKVGGSGDPMMLTADLEVDDLEFLSQRILDMPDEERRANRDKLIKTMEERTLKEDAPGPFSVEVRGARAVIKLAEIQAASQPSEVRVRATLESVKSLPGKDQ